MKAGIRGLLAGLLVLMVSCTRSDKAPVLVAVASNFQATAEVLVAEFERQHGYEITLVPGSTGKHYAQIQQGAPYGLFLAADSERPERLLEHGYGVPNSLEVYALGRLALWQPLGQASSVRQQLEDGQFRHLAMANPKLAPYGRAARQSLEHLGLWERYQDRVVTGENVAQAFQFVATGNAEVGFVAYAQVTERQVQRPNLWIVPIDHHEPIAQKMVLLGDRPGERAFWRFLIGTRARQLIEARGYGLPDR